MSKKLLAVDIFAGAGGLSLGFEKAGFTTLFAVEQDKNSAETYRKNRKNYSERIINEDICNVDFKKMLKKFKIKKSEVDILLGGPPCQGYSLSNTRNRLKINKQNNLFKEYFRAVDEINPKWILFENVAEIIQYRKGNIVNIFYDRLKKLGYNKIYYKILNAAEYGVPQIRRRFFLIANRLSINFSFPKETHCQKNFRTVKDAISDLPVIRNGNMTNEKNYKNHGFNMTPYQEVLRKRIKKKYIFNNLVTKNSDLVCKRYLYIPQGGNWRDIPEELMNNYKNIENCHTGIYKRLNEKKPSIVISNFRKNMLIHPTQTRGLSVREAARIQSFPDTYVFYGSLGNQQQQVANSVPPLLANTIGIRIYKLMKERIKIS